MKTIFKIAFTNLQFIFEKNLLSIKYYNYLTGLFKQYRD